MRNINISYIALIVSITGLLVSFINVNRQRKAAYKNETEKFKRDLRLKANDEFIELLFQFLENTKEIRTLSIPFDERYLNTDIKVRTKEFDERFWKITKTWIKCHSALETFYLKRIVVIKQYSDLYIIIRQSGIELDKALWDLKNDYIGTEDITLIKDKVNTYQLKAEKFISLLEGSIQKLQKDFLGDLFE
ncbi:hypothetical protein V3851_06110 [Paenibacillus sp. M1]|uniref:Uncharacterized protein n=1 Tax=Paenibacillus haidiansis TaxID=1574488 RepID=A0ABU7VQ19_9BACL